MAIPVLGVVVGLLLWLISAAGLAISCADAAAAGARAAARGDSDPQVIRLVRSVGPPRAQVAIERAGGWVTVEVRVRVHPPGPAPLPALVVSRTARAAAEETGWPR